MLVTTRLLPKPRKPREKARRMFLCDVEPGEALVLVPRRGCWITAIDKAGNITRDREHDSQRRLFVNRGDRLMVWGSVANDEIALVEVEHIEPRGFTERLGVRTIAGAITAATTTAMVMTASGTTVIP